MREIVRSEGEEGFIYIYCPLLVNHRYADYDSATLEMIDSAGSVLFSFN